MKTISPRRAITRFSKIMELKLRENDHKEHWRNFGHSYLFHDLELEVRELSDAIRTGNQKEIQKEAADIANFAMMISDNARKYKVVKDDGG